MFQDRSFVNSTTTGDMLYPTFPQNGVQGSSGLAGMPPYPYGTLNGPWTAEAFGDEGLVNGLVAPFFNVEPRLYRFRCLNGCNARILDLQLVGGLVGGVAAATPPPMWIIGNDGGLLPAPVKIKTLTMMPGERYDVLVDFKGYTGKVQFKNTNLNGFYTSPAPRLVDFLQFQVGTTVTDPTNSTVPTTLVGGQHANVPATGATPVRTINMFEMNAGAMNWWMGLIGSGGVPGVDVDVQAGGFADRITPAWNANTFHQEIGERPAEGTVQEWDFVNNTADSHPMHIHLVQFQVVHRRKIGRPVPPRPGRWSTPGRRAGRTPSRCTPARSPGCGSGSTCPPCPQRCRLPPGTWRPEPRRTTCCSPRPPPGGRRRSGASCTTATSWSTRRTT